MNGLNDRKFNLTLGLYVVEAPLIMRYSGTNIGERATRSPFCYGRDVGMVRVPIFLGMIDVCPLMELYETVLHLPTLKLLFEGCGTLL